MTTPICDFVRRYASDQACRLHMPGHKGSGVLGIEQLDITEIEGADVLYHASGIIRESEENAAALFGTAKTLYSTEGSSLSIRAMLYLTLLYAASVGQPMRIFAGRNAHRTLMSAAALLDFDPVWLCSEEDTLLSCHITAEGLEKRLCEGEKPVAVYLTSPDYLGQMADISALAAVCHRHGVLLLVDNAHGAYLRFCEEDRHPITLGADLCCDSAHKTLPVLTGGGYLHISRNAPSLFADMAERAMSLFASTSPSYLILQSLDAANRYLAEQGAQEIRRTCRTLQELKHALVTHGFAVTGDEPMKLTVMPKSYGYTGTQLAAYLAEHGLICEFSDPDFCVMMLTPKNQADVAERIRSACTALPHRAPIEEMPPASHLPRRVMSIRQALLSCGRACAVEDAVGCVLADASIACPPAVPIAVCGERIDKETVALFRYYGIERVRVTEV